ncbi:MAG: 3-isopropylmalate dehydratase small subunit [Cellvibrionales bacterium]|nr:3-isopropylmalate dehydratase small subunit [Cellvibrionales bacterium]
MQPFTRHRGLVGPLDRANVDTDLITPKQYLKSIERSGFGRYLFDPLRYLDEGWLDKPENERRPNPDFALNQPRYRGCSVLLTRANFGCGSSREHAPWALADYGFRALIAPSYADIFYNNCCKNGLLPVVQPEAVVERLFAETLANPGYELTIDLEQQHIETPAGERLAFHIDAFRKGCLLAGLDEIGLTLQSAAAIKAYEQQRAAAEPWVFGVLDRARL